MTEITPERKANRKKATIIMICVLVCVAAGALVTLKLIQPYSITADGKQVVVVDKKSDADKVMKNVIKSYMPEGTKSRSISLDKELDVSHLSVKNILDDEKVFTQKEAEDYILKKNQTDKPVFTATIVSTAKRHEEFDPKPVYERNDEMFAGDAKVLSEGTKGERVIITEYTSVNGVVTNTEEKVAEIINKGESAHIAKGTLGLPDGVDWKTYEGNPIYKDGDDLMAAAETYKGLRYIYGGKDLNRGVSCIGFVVAMYQKYGIKLPMSMSKIRTVGKGISLKDARPGDIICYKGHVALYKGNGYVIDSTSSRGVGIGKVHGGIITIRRVVK